MNEHAGVHVRSGMSTIPSPCLDPVMMAFMDKNGMDAASAPGSTAATARLINSRAAADSCRAAVGKLAAAFQRK